MTVHIKLYGEKGDRFEEIKAELAEQLGYEPTNPEVVGYLMGNASHTALFETGSTRRGEAD